MSSGTAKSVTDPHPASAPDYTPVPLLRDLQLKRLQAIVTRAWQQVKLFRARMDELGLAPQDIRTLEDIAKLPFTVKSDLRDSYPFGLFASPMRDVVRLHASSGTTGKPIVVAYTKEDVDVWTSVMVSLYGQLRVASWRHMFRTPMAMASLPAAWVSTMALKGWGRR